MSDTRKKVGIIFVLIAVAIIVGVLIHRNTDTYKTKKATELIAEGKCIEASNILFDVYTPEAAVIKKFVEVENAKIEFVNAMESESDGDDWEKYEAFQNALKNFNEKNSGLALKGKLYDKYNTYSAAFGWIGEYTYESLTEPNTLYQALGDIQSVIINRIERENSKKDGIHFTLKQFDERVHTSQFAYEPVRVLAYGCTQGIEVTDSSVQEYCYTEKRNDESGDEKLVIRISFELQTLFANFTERCESEISESQSFIKENSQKFELDAKLYNTTWVSYDPTNPDENKYYWNIGNLLPISVTDSWEDISNNRDILLQLLRTDMLYYMLEGKTTDI